jgi:hypothetical protein
MAVFGLKIPGKSKLVTAVETNEIEETCRENVSYICRTCKISGE